jgi:fatty-acyl-CoA synthase
VKDHLTDGIKSYGEWIPNIALESALARQPSVAETSVIGVPDPRWQERPLVCAKLPDGAPSIPEELRYTSHRAARHTVCPPRRIEEPLP